MSIMDAPDGPRAAGRRAMVVVGAAVIVTLSILVPLHAGEPVGGAWIRTVTPVADTAGGHGMGAVSGGMDPAGVASSTVTTGSIAPPPTRRAGAGATSTTAAVRRQSAPHPPTTIGPSAPSIPSTVLPAPKALMPPAAIVAPAVVTSLPVPTSVQVCRNSADPSCGPFRFDPQPAADRPMTVRVVADPATTVAGQEVVFHLTLTDPDGVLYGSSLFEFGDSGIGDSSAPVCGKFGPWDPPARGATAGVRTLDVRHTYFAPGTYSATFSFDPGPYSCTDSVTGRGDRPYASPGKATVDLVVG